MTSTKKQMIAGCIREARLAKGYTQKELSGLANISVRSIQRIENGDIIPRSYTLKNLSGVLEIPFETFQDQPVQTDAVELQELSKPVPKINNTQKIILSIGLPLLVFFGCWAYIAQSPTFPETLFELLSLITIVLLLIIVFLFMIWRVK
jgi:transcriptional regulator with XRE-family HTH domain